MDGLSAAVLIGLVLGQGAWFWYLTKKRTGKETWTQYNLKEKMRKFSLYIIGLIIFTAGVLTAKLIMWLYDQAR